MDYFFNNDNLDMTRVKGHNYFREAIGDSIYKIELEEEYNNDDRKLDGENDRRKIK